MKTKTHNIGAGWYATFHVDGELVVHAHSRATEIRLPVKSVDRLREIFRKTDDGATS